VKDEQVNGVGQSSSYGKIVAVTEVPYLVKNLKGEETGDVRTCIKIDH
jgi:hypothetical protein